MSIQIPESKIAEFGLRNPAEIQAEFASLYEFITVRFSPRSANREHRKRTAQKAGTWEIALGNYPEYWVVPTWVAQRLDEMGYDIVTEKITGGK